MVRNHAEEKRGKARTVINYEKVNNNTVFDDFYIPNKAIASIEVHDPLWSRKWTVKPDIDK